VVEFGRTEEGLYSISLPEGYKSEVIQENKKNKTGYSGVTTVAENRKNYSTAQFERAKKARKLYHILGAPSTSNYKKILRGNMIKDCPVVEKDVDIAEAIFGADISTIKGKTARRTPRPIIQDLISVPPELVRKHSSIELCIDVMYVNRIGFLTSIGYPIYYRKTVHVTNGKNETLYNGLDKILRIYNAGGYRVNIVNCDNGFRKMMDDVKDKLDCTMNYTNAQDHEPHAERNNRTIKNQIRV
jgi:hypothetical protein